MQYTISMSLSIQNIRDEVSHHPWLVFDIAISMSDCHDDRFFTRRCAETRLRLNSVTALLVVVATSVLNDQVSSTSLWRVKHAGL